MDKMGQMPDFLQPFYEQAKAILKKGLVRDIEFSGGTYQVQVVDPRTKQEVWAFLQLDSKGGISDCFCSCEDGEEFTYCAHLAAAFLRVYQGESLPLHLRFQKSLWNQLCRLFSDRLGDDPDQFTVSMPGCYKRVSVGGKVIFSVMAKTPVAQERLKTLIEQRKKETEETSLKFSNLTSDELTLWREGRPSAQLRYELSFWNDLAHWLMQMQDTAIPYEIRFKYAENDIPNEIIIAFPDLEVEFYLSEANLPHIIPALATVNSPLKVHHALQESIIRISYDKDSGSLFLETTEIKPSKKEAFKKEKSIQLSGWRYVPGDGFYALDQHELLTNPRLSGNQVSYALDEYYELIQQYLDGIALHSDPVSISYSLHFDAEWNLHVMGYVFAPGDLTAPGSRYFGKWIYLDDDGFYPVEESHFDTVEKIIPAAEVSDFIRTERSWLNTIEGFSTHVAGMEVQLVYTLSNDNRLSFSRLEPGEARPGNKDFDGWVYIPGQGFYARVGTYTSLPVNTDVAIHADQIPLFIRMNLGELSLIPHFFSEKCPVASVKLHVNLTTDEAISVVPEYVLFPDYIGKDVRFFDEFVYVAGEGFHELPVDSRLPERFRSAMLIEPENVPLFLMYELDSLTAYSPQIDPRLLKPDELILSADSLEKVDLEGIGWYLLKIYYDTGRGQVSIADIWQAFREKRRFLFTPAGWLNLQEQRFDWIKLIPKGRVDRRSDTIKLSTLELIRLHALEGILFSKQSKKRAQSEALLRELTEFQMASEPDLTGLKGELRPYQKLGVHWLWFLYNHQLSGLLCDDMGLGKTHQTMALLAAILNVSQQHGYARSHFLVICPTSVIYHWEEKLKIFFPNLRICLYHGGERSLNNFQQQYDLLLTSYSIWRLDHEQLSALSFEVAIFDEIQIAKNHNSRIHAALRHVNANMRLGLTGTPIENHLKELKALFDLVLPLYMPSEADYRELFVKPIEKEGSKERRQLLSRFIKPFILRRKKDEVLPDLPEKMEEIVHCDLLPEQYMLYQQALQQSRERLIQQLQDSATPIPYLHIFALLSSLKQICNHPAVYLKQPKDYKKHESGKWDLFVELLSEARESQQKVVIFSQYLSMLDIFEDYLDENGIGFATIRGSTTNRGQQVHRFNHDPNCEVFLGSLQAAGLGVDLTAGSVVIHYDRWWNAARENQATDRVHRIGQTRGVQVFKIVTKGTFEERIDELITKKGRLMEEVVSSDDYRFMKAFDRAELLQLLQEVEEIKL